MLGNKILQCVYELINLVKMFTYFCNKFRPLYCMQYIKCSVNILLLT